MSNFTKPLILEPIDGKRWKLVEEFDYWTILPGEKVTIKVPSGFITDFASTPKILWPIFPPWDKYGKAAVLHDYLYSTKLFPRKTCDKIFKEAMTVLKVPKWKRELMYLAVRLFGKSHYDKNFLKK